MHQTFLLNNCYFSHLNNGRHPISPAMSWQPSIISLINRSVRESPIIMHLVHTRLWRQAACYIAWIEGIVPCAWEHWRRMTTELLAHVSCRDSVTLMPPSICSKLTLIGQQIQGTNHAFTSYSHCFRSLPTYIS